MKNIPPIKHRCAWEFFLTLSIRLRAINSPMKKLVPVLAMISGSAQSIQAQQNLPVSGKAKTE